MKNWFKIKNEFQADFVEQIESLVNWCETKDSFEITHLSLIVVIGMIYIDSEQ